MRCQLTGFILLAASALPAQTKADSALVARLLTAEDRRDSAAAAFREGLASPNPQVRLIAARGWARVKDSAFAKRDSLPAPSAAPAYLDPDWRLRFRALARKPLDCSLLRAGPGDDDPHVVLRAIDLMSAECSNATVLTELTRLVSAPSRTSARKRGHASWQLPAHSLVTLARLSPGTSRTPLSRLAKSSIPWVRVYAARAARELDDTTTLRALAADPDDNVKEAAVDGLAKVAGHSADDTYLRAPDARGYQAIRAAAVALEGTPRSEDVIRAGQRVLARLRADSSETSRDARVAVADRLREAGVANVSAELLKAPAPVPLAPEAAALAFGKQVVLRVTLADSSGGGHFDVRLRGDVAPITTARVLQLVRSGFYNNRAWFRVEPDFVIEGGGPGNNEYVGYPRFFRDELSALPQVRGTVGMSTRGHDTGDAQWFVNLRDNLRLTRDYTSFGEVIDGIDVVDGILEGDVIARIEVVSSSAPRR